MVMAQVRRNVDDFVWTHVPSIKELGRRRLWAMRRFLSDYAVGMEEGRYVDASLPELPFADGAFDLALSSHFLFLYTEEFNSISTSISTPCARCCVRLTRSASFRCSRSAARRRRT